MILSKTLKTLAHEDDAAAHVCHFERGLEELRIPRAHEALQVLQLSGHAGCTIARRWLRTRSMSSCSFERSSTAFECMRCAWMLRGGDFGADFRAHIRT
jgi:hypothetical protein